MAVLFNLLRPERSPNASRWTVVVGAAMPEAAVDQNHDSLSWKDDVSRATDICHRSNVDAVAQPRRVQNPPHGEFGCAVTTSGV